MARNKRNNVIRLATYRRQSVKLTTRLDAAMHQAALRKSVKVVSVQCMICTTSGRMAEPLAMAYRKLGLPPVCANCEPLFEALDVVRQYPTKIVTKVQYLMDRIYDGQRRKQERRQTKRKPTRRKLSANRRRMANENTSQDRQ